MRNFFHCNWPVFFGKNPPDTFDILPLTTSRNAFGNDLLLLFVGSNPSPDFVFKMCRNPQFNFKITREYDSLKSLCRDHSLKQYLPSPVYLGDLHGRSFLLQEGIQGTTLGRLIQKKKLIIGTRK